MRHGSTIVLLLWALASSAPAQTESVTAPQISQRLDELHSWLGTNANGQRWKEFVRSEELAKELAKGHAADQKVVSEILALYQSRTYGINDPHFVAVRSALEEWLRESSASGPLTPAALRDDQVVPAVALVSAPANNHSNLYAATSNRLVQAGFSDTAVQSRMNRPQAVHDRILGTRIHGTAYPRLGTQLHLIPNPRQATFDIQLYGSAMSKNVGYNGPVTVWTTGHTSINAHKYIYLGANGVGSSAASATAATSTTIDDLCAKCKVIERIAWKKAGETKEDAECIASSRAAGRIAGQVDREVGSRVAEANADYNDRFRNRLVKRDSFPRLFQTSTTSDTVQLEMLHANASQSAATSAPPVLADALDLSVRIHETAVTNFAESMLGGETITDERLIELLTEAKVEIPEELKISPDKDPWSITFAKQHPVTAAFAGSTAKLAIRGTKFTRGDTAVNAVIEIGATYKLERGAAGLILTRDGDVSVEYVNLKQLSIGQVAMKTFFRKKFEAMFSPTKSYDGLKLPERFHGIAKLHLKQLQADQGWMALGWSETADAPKVALAEAR